jgi:hypothetical protein
VALIEKESGGGLLSAVLALNGYLTFFRKRSGNSLLSHNGKDFPGFRKLLHKELENYRYSKHSLKKWWGFCRF